MSAVLCPTCVFAGFVRPRSHRLALGEVLVHAVAVGSHELVGNFHTHTRYSDGSNSHDEIASAAVSAGLDVLAYTDHNVRTNRDTGWYTCPSTVRRVLRLMGEEVNDFLAVGRHGHAGMGDQIGFEDGLIVRAHVPRSAHIRLLRDGQVAAQAHGYQLHHAVPGPGVYRVEVHRDAGRRSVLRVRPQVWILSNPIYVRA